MRQDRKIPFVDLVAQHKELESELLDVIKGTLHTAAFIGGPAVEGFERDFAKFCNTKVCAGVSSGTDALRFALIAAGIRPGDIVLTVPLTFIATTEAITQVGACADFVDIDAVTYTMDVERLRHYLAHQCKLDLETGKLIHKKNGRPVTAIVPVHLYGQPADMDPILEIASRYKLIVIEDACQAHGAEYFSSNEKNWRKAGSMGQAAAFSFYPGKNLGACGEGGAVTTNDENLARKVRMLRDHGQAKKYYHELEGYNGRLDALQAGILRAKLSRLAGWNQMRREAAGHYTELLAPMADLLGIPREPSWARSNYHLYVIRSAERDRLLDHLTGEGVGVGIHYPVPVHLQRPYRERGFQQGDFPESEKAAQEILSLPMYPQLKIEDQVRVVEAIREFYLAKPTKGSNSRNQQFASVRNSSTE
jgi:dTDP-4-amino-4,6-dideoxygalactose transaminase